MILSDYRQFGGVHPETAAIKNILAFHGVKAPHTGEPFSEAMLLGIGGGLGMGYILWEFKETDTKAIALGFRNNWQYPVRFLRALSGRLHVNLGLLETSGKKAADKKLRDELKAGRPMMVWASKSGLPYLRIPEGIGQHWGHVVSVYGLDEKTDEILIDDRAAKPFRAPSDTLADARNSIPSYKNRLVWIEGTPKTVPLEEAIWEGLRDCVEHLGKTSDSFSLPALRKWARTMTDVRNKKGWPLVFAGGKGLFRPLRFLCETTLGLNGDGPLRDLYADFLEEAAPIIDKPRLAEVAERYRGLNQAWAELGDAALPNANKTLSRVKEALLEKHRLMMVEGDRDPQKIEALNEDIYGGYEALNETFPMNERRTLEFFGKLQRKLISIFREEQAALARLRAAIGPAPTG